MVLNSTLPPSLKLQHLWPVADQLDLIRSRSVDDEQLTFSDWLEVVSPSWQWDADHHREIQKCLQRVTDGDINRLMIFMPPRHGKSESITVRYTAWRLENDPTLPVIIAAYNHTLAQRFSRKIRKIARERISLSSERTAVDEWETAQGGGVRAVGVGGGVTGMGGKCLPAGTLVATNCGNIPIEQLEHYPTSVKIVAYDTDRKQFQFKAAQAFSMRQADGVYRITTTSGRVVEATGDHPFWTGRGYTKASELAPGDSVLRLVQARVSTRGVRDEQAHQSWARGCVLLEGLLLCPSRDQEPSWVQSVWTPDSQEDAHLLRSMSSPAHWSQCDLPAGRDYVPDVQSGIHGEVARCESRRLRTVLLEGVLEQGALTTYVGTGQSEVETWGYSTSTATAFSESIPRYASADSGARRQRLCSLQSHDPIACSPYRQLADEQCSVKSGDALRQMPFTTSCRDGFQATTDTVAVVERICAQTTVYDLQVADTHNFFANGILVHNCIIIDDPVKSREEADSATFRDRVWEWYTDDLYTRREPGAAMILVMTRWHQDDLAGRILASDDGPNWTVLHLPAIALEGDALGREPGEALWPERYPTHELDNIHASIGDRGWYALYQGMPQPEGGAVFLRDWWDGQNRYDPREKYRPVARVMFWDTAEEDNDDAAFTVAVVGEIDRDYRMRIVDVVRQRVAFPDLVPLVERTAHKHNRDGLLRAVDIEYASSGRQAYQTIMAQSPQWLRQLMRRFNPKSSKEIRAQAAAAWCQNGMVLLPMPDESVPWLYDFERELYDFPTGAFKDQVDAFSGLVNRRKQELTMGYRQRRMPATEQELANVAD